MKKIPPKYPHFFKPIFPGFKNGVKIPIAFLAKYMRGQGPKLAILRRGDRRWRVKINGRMLADGWEKFAADNGLHVLDIVVFRHGGDKVFDVTVFDVSGCEREYPPLPRGGCSVPQPSKSFSSGDLNQKSTQAVIEGSVPDLERADSKQNVSYPEHKRPSTSKNDHPFFVSTLHHYSLKLSNVNIPSDFARENGLLNRQCKMILRDLKQRSWSVELDCRRYRVSIKHGWDKFCGANGLVEGDAFVFKLIDNGETPIAEVYAETIAQGVSTSSADHPHFVATIKPYCLRKPNLYLPIEFARSNGLVAAGKREMILRDDKERSWSIVLGRMGNHVGLLRGWHAFQMANGLKEGDAYKFELIESGKKPIAKFHCTASTSPADHPHFVSTIKPYCLKYLNLYLPIEFARSYGLMEAGKREMILRDDKGRSWPVVLGRTGRHFGLLRGWQAFHMANGLKEGDAYKFEVIESGKKPIAKFHCTASTSASEHPHFVSTVKPYCLKNQKLYLPIEFARSNGLVAAEKREMILRDDKERSWSTVLGRLDDHVGILRGWDAFQMANGLKEGDAYKFELIENGKKLIAKFHCEYENFSLSQF